MQNRAMREYAARRGWIIAQQVKEVGSGASQRQLRENLLEAARRREIDVVLVWRLDRWGRSVADLLTTLQELEHLGVGFVSLTEALDLTTPAGRAMAGMLAVFAAFEREILGERVRAGLAHARAERDPLFAAEVPDFIGEIRRLFTAGEIRDYLDQLEKTKYLAPTDPDLEMDELDEPDEPDEEEPLLENPVSGAEELLRFSRIRQLLQS
jgi:DNA invertase Pin-like site-specific DNA recombinase